MAVFAINVRAKLTDTNPTLVHTVTAGRFGTLTVNVGALLANKVKVAVTAGAAPVDADWIEPGQALALGGVLERERVVAPAGYRIYAQTDTANSCAVQVWGIEETN